MVLKAREIRLLRLLSRERGLGERHDEKGPRLYLCSLFMVGARKTLPHCANSMSCFMT